ncbi:MAG: hypothetical protein ACRECQ_06150 [Burkholderiaceae bacterium]
MSAAQVLIDGFLKAAEMLALLVLPPAFAVEPPVIPMSAQLQRARELHLLTSTADVRLLGMPAAVRISDDEDEGCGGESDDEEDVYVAGHARLALDEAIADAAVTAPLIKAGAAHRLELPAHVATEPRALLVDQHDSQFVLVMTGLVVRGAARLTLRFAEGSPQTIELGELGATPAAYVVPVADRTALAALARGAIELEAQAKDYVLWSTLPAQVRADASVAIVRAEK